MPNDQTSKTTDASSLVKQEVLETPTIGLDSLLIDDLLEQLDEEESKQEKIEASETSDTSNEKVALKTEVLPVTKNLQKQEIPKKEETEETKEDSQQKIADDENIKIKFSEIFESVKKAKAEYEELEQENNEESIFGVQAVETYLNWVKESRKLLKECSSREDQGKASAIIPKRLQKQLSDGTAPPHILNDSGDVDLHIKEPQKSEEPPSLNETRGKKDISSTDKESILNERIRKLEERIQRLDQNSPEYVEELVPLEIKKTLVKEEIKNKKDETLTDTDREKLEQDLSTQKLINKQSFENKAPIAQPKKEERERIKKAQLAEELEKEEEEKAPPPIVIKKEEVPVPSYGAEQLDAANEIRGAFQEQLSSVEKSDWYKSPSVNRDLVNKQIIKVAAILSGKESMDIDMNDIQTARIFMYNEAPEEILKHPSFYYVESFYNYQSSQGCLGVNAEEIFSGQENPDYKPKNSSDTEEGRFFIDQISPKK